LWNLSKIFSQLEELELHGSAAIFTIFGGSFETNYNLRKITIRDCDYFKDGQKLVNFASTLEHLEISCGLIVLRGKAIEKKSDRDMNEPEMKFIIDEMLSLKTLHLHGKQIGIGSKKLPSSLEEVSIVGILASPISIDSYHKLKLTLSEPTDLDMIHLSDPSLESLAVEKLMTLDDLKTWLEHVPISLKSLNVGTIFSNDSTRPLDLTSLGEVIHSRLWSLKSVTITFDQVNLSSTGLIQFVRIFDSNHALKQVRVILNGKFPPMEQLPHLQYKFESFGDVSLLKVSRKH
jgi:hypothetical protein